MPHPNSPKPNLFVVVATGQAIANLPPVLEVAQKNDEVLWIVSDEAHQRNWLTGPNQVFQRFGLKSLPMVRVGGVSDPYTLTQALASKVNSIQPDQYQNIYLVTNGGTKHTPIALLRAFESLSPVLLYGEDRPCVYNIHSANFQSPPQRENYTRHTLDLESIISLRSYTFATGSTHVQIWPRALSQEVVNEPYGQDEQYTYSLHTQHHKRASFSKNKADQVPFERIRSLVPVNQYEKWETNVRQIQIALNHQSRCNLYHSTLKLAEIARKAAERQANEIPQTVDPIGPALERAVARRVRRWQEENRHPGIQSIWTGVKLAQANMPDRVEVEFDTLIVLKNGILVHLECKSADMKFSQIDANTHRLQGAGSQLASVAVVIPLFTKCTTEPWFAQYHQIKIDSEIHFGPRNVIPFTWPDQPRGYRLSEESVVRDYTCESFEAQLSALLKPYAASEK